MSGKRYQLADGVMWCPLHQGVADEIRTALADDRCDMAQPCGNTECEEGAIPDPDDPEYSYIDCPDCDGTGYAPCDLRPLFYETKP